MDNQKVNTQISEGVIELIEQDMDYFKLSKGKMGNRIFSYYKDRNIEYRKKSQGETRTLQFHLSNENNEIVSLVLRDNKSKGIKSKSDLFRSMLDDYQKRSRGEREKILYYKNYEAIKKAIDNGKKVWIRKGAEERIVFPAALIMNEGKRGFYLLGWCEKNLATRNFRLKNIKVLMEKEEAVREEIIEELEYFKRNWDPYLSINEEVKIRFEDEVLVELEVATTGKPKLKKVEDGVHTFQCTIFQGKNYFIRFIGKFEVVEPKGLKDYFDERIGYILEKFSEKN